MADIFWHTQLWCYKKDELMEALFGDDSDGADFVANQDHLRSIKVSIDDLNPDGRAVLDAMLNTLLAIAGLDDERTVSYALHGLGHLHHPEGSARMQQFIDDNRDEYNEQSIQWLEQCRDGTVM